MATAPGASVREPAAREPSAAVRIGDMRLWLMAFITSILICMAYAAIASGHVVARNVLYSVAEIGAILAIAIGVRRYRPNARHAWLLVAGGLFMFWIGDLLWAVYEIGGRDPYPSLADIFYIAGYPLLAGGLFVATRRRMPIIDIRAPIDAAIVAASALLFEWFYVIGPTLSDSTLSWQETVVTIAYPVLDVIVLAVAVRFVMGRGWNVVALRLLVLGLGLTLLGDALYSLDVVSRLNSYIYAVDTMLLAGVLLIGLAGLHPSMTAFTAEASEPEERAHVRRLILLAVVCFLPPILLIVQALQGKPLYLPATLTAMVLLAGLVIARFTYMTTSASRAADREAALSRYSAQLLRSNGKDELLRVASRATIELVGEGQGWLVQTGSDPPSTGQAITVPVEVRGEVPAVLVADVKPPSVRSVRDSLTTIAAELSLALEREHLLDRLRQAAEALTEQNEQLRELDRMKDQFVSSVSHELRTPLTSMVGYLELVLGGETGPVQAEQRRFLEIVSRSCDRLNRLVDDILFVARVDAGHLSLERQLVDLRRLAAESVETARGAAAGKQIDVRFSDDNGLPPVCVDPTRMTQLFDNLLSNAIKFTPEHGTVSVTISRRGDDAHVEVADTGVGIPERECGRLFDRFFRASTAASAPGTGLGLPIVKSIVEAHGGMISVESEERVGTTFFIDLPLEADVPLKPTSRR
jgi:signal transduction histidine kinase